MTIRELLNLNKNLPLSLFTAIVLTACGGGSDNDGGGDGPVNPQPPTPEKKEIMMMSRSASSDFTFGSGDAIGVYVVNYSGSTPGTLASTGNHVNNMKFTYNGSAWSGTTKIYWKDETTKADFYGYWPYMSNIGNVASVSFSVKTDQSSEANFRSSEFLRGKTSGVAPTTSIVNLSLSHVMSQINIKLQAGDGFTTEELSAADISVSINGLKPASSINLSTGAVTATGAESSLKAYKESNLSYKAIVVPQTVTETDIVTVKIGSDSYNLNKSMTFESGKTHTATMTLNKTSGGITVTVGNWTVDDTDFGGSIDQELDK